MAEIVYLLCSILSLICSFLLFRGYRKGRSRLLLWSGWCFGILAVSNCFLFVDMTIFPTVDLNGPLIRSFLGALSGTLLLFGLIWEVK